MDCVILLSIEADEILFVSWLDDIFILFVLFYFMQKISANDLKYFVCCVFLKTRQALNREYAVKVV